jgi:hypothetical protein
MELIISQEAYERYLKKENAVINKRLRSDEEDFLDALLSVDMTSTPDRQKTLEAIRKLN